MTAQETDDRAFRLFGTRVQEPASRLLRAGRMTARFVAGGLRAISYDGVEVLRAIAFVVRDRDWGTYSPDISDLTVEEGETETVVTYRALCEGPGQSRLSIRAAITLSTTGSMVFRAEAKTDTGFETNRCGFCVLHPIVGVAGTPVKVEHVDGSAEDAVFPDLIAPWQPFQDIRALTHQVMPGVDAQCRMEGDTFEMEDQRNWSDASYKTYVRPLALPWPYEIGSGEGVAQTITLSVSDRRAQKPLAQHEGDKPVTLTWGEDLGRLPDIGLVVTPEDARATRTTLAEIGHFGASALILHFDPGAGHGLAALQDFAALAASFSGTTSLEIALPCQRPVAEELAEIANLVGEAGLRLDAIIVSPSVDRQSTPPGSRWPDCPPLADVYVAAAGAFPTVRLGGGMLSYFTEINRKRVPAERLDFVSHATNPIVHAADDASVMETLEALPFIGRSLRAIYGDRPYRVGPSTLAMRQNPYGSRTMDNPDGRRIAMANRDPRHNGLFGAAFAAGYAAGFVSARLEQLTLSALTGPFGLIAGEGEPVPPGTVRPVGRSVEMLAGMAGWSAQAVDTGASRAVLGLAARERSGHAALLVVNVTSGAVSVDLDKLGLPRAVQLSMLDESTMINAAARGLSSTPFTGASLVLAPYAVAQLRWLSP
jgi:D-apionolactonase